MIQLGATGVWLFKELRHNRDQEPRAFTAQTQSAQRKRKKII